MPLCNICMIQSCCLVILMYLLTVIDTFKLTYRPSTYTTWIRKYATSSPLNSSNNAVKGNKVLAYGRVTECRGGTTYLVQIENSDRKVLCELGGTLYRRRKFVTVNTRVKIEAHLLSPNKGRIVERIDDYKDALYSAKCMRTSGPGWNDYQSV